MLANERTIQEIAQRLVDFYRPVRVYLFGSRARGDDGPDSDLDFCVVVPDSAPREFFRAGAAWVRASLPATVIREGRVLYEAK